MIKFLVSLLVIFCTFFFSSCDTELVYILRNKTDSNLKIISSSLDEKDGKDSLGNYYKILQSHEEAILGNFKGKEFHTSYLPEYFCIIKSDTTMVYTNKEEFAKMFECDGKIVRDRCKSGTWVYEVK